jgi:hypothetical protein
MESGIATVAELLRQGKKREIWERFCGFLDLTTDGFMDIQRKLLEEQLPRLAGCELGRRVMRGRTPKTLEEFRATVPFTTYKDYVPFLLERNEAVLPEKPYAWVHTSGRSGEYEMKWIPYTKRLYELGGETAMSCFLIASGRNPGDVNLREGMSFLYTIAPPPYISGIFTESLISLFPFSVYPPPEAAKAMDFQKRVQAAFASALSEGLDFFYGVTSILLKISESFAHLGGGGGGSMGNVLRNPKALWRIAKALIKSTVRGRPLLPKDLWNVKGLVCGGMDTGIFKDKVAKAWGVTPIEAYGSTELGICATQTWSYEGFTFFPQVDFLEFISEADYRAYMKDPSKTPRALLLSEVTPNTEYVLVGTNFHGGILVRYILGDLIKIVSMRDERTGVKLPQATFVARVDDVIDIGGFTRLTEKTIWQAIENSGVPYDDWTIRKEAEAGKPVLHLYMEMRDGPPPVEAIVEKVHARLKELDANYRDLEDITGLKPLRVSLLSKGTFRRYYEERQAAGADLAHLKPPHVNATEKMVENLLRMSSWKI